MLFLTVCLHRLLYLSARSISQAADTKFYLEQLRQDGLSLPPGPLFLNPKSLLQVFVSVSVFAFVIVFVVVFVFVFVFVFVSVSLPAPSLLTQAPCCRPAGWR